MIRWPDTIVSRAVLVLAGALLALHVVGYWAYRVGAESIATHARDRGLSERIISIKRAISSIPTEAERDRAAHALATASLDVHWGRVSLIIGTGKVTERAQAMEARLKELAPDFAAEAFRVGYADDGALGAGDTEAYRHMMLVSVRLEDGSWVNFASPSFGGAPWLAGNAFLFAICIGLGIVVIAIILLRWVTRPLRDLAVAAEKFNLETPHEPLDENGPAEVRRASKAFNAMEARIRRLVSERTQALGAVSHDLRTPIARLRLRAELLDDEEMRRRVQDDLGDMESMIDSTLEFLKLGASGEPKRQVDLSSLVETIVDEEVDKGSRISFEVLESSVIEGQPVSLKRAFWNVIGNALKYGEVVSVAVFRENGKSVVHVDDDGPGIPPDLIDRAFEPFYRVEASRSRQTGGTGLGLTIARQILRAHGGEVWLMNRTEGGLRTRIELPIAEHVLAKTPPTHQRNASVG